MINQAGYDHTITTALHSAAKDFGAGLAGLPPAFRAAYQALLAGNFSGAESDVATALEHLFVTGFNSSNLSNITLLGPVGDLLPILSIPGHMAQNVTNVINTLTDTTMSVNLANLFSPSFVTGLPLALTLDALGAPVTTLKALESSGTAFIGAVQAGSPQAALVSPAHVERWI